MKNLLESFAVFLVVALSLLIIFLIVQYNMIEEEAVEEIVMTKPVTKAAKKAKTKNYLDSLEGYGGDVDVKVDATKENIVNAVAVQAEAENEALNSAVEDQSKSSYMENLANYQDETEKKDSEGSVKAVTEEKKPEVTQVKDPEDPEKLPEDEVDDEIGMAIDAALDDL